MRQPGGILAMGYRHPLGFTGLIGGVPSRLQRGLRLGQPDNGGAEGQVGAVQGGLALADFPRQALQLGAATEGPRRTGRTSQEDGAVGAAERAARGIENLQSGEQRLDPGLGSALRVQAIAERAVADLTAGAPVGREQDDGPGLFGGVPRLDGRHDGTIADQDRVHPLAQQRARPLRRPPGRCG